MNGTERKAESRRLAQVLVRYRGYLYQMIGRLLCARTNVIGRAIRFVAQSRLLVAELDVFEVVWRTRLRQASRRRARRRLRDDKSNSGCK